MERVIFIITIIRAQINRVNRGRYPLSAGPNPSKSRRRAELRQSGLNHIIFVVELRPGDRELSASMLIGRFAEQPSALAADQFPHLYGICRSDGVTISGYRSSG